MRTDLFEISMCLRNKAKWKKNSYFEVCLTLVITWLIYVPKNEFSDSSKLFVLNNRVYIKKNNVNYALWKNPFSASWVSILICINLFGLSFTDGFKILSYFASNDLRIDLEMGLLREKRCLLRREIKYHMECQMKFYLKIWLKC